MQGPYCVSVMTYIRANLRFALLRSTLATQARQTTWCSPPVQFLCPQSSM